MGIAAGGLIKQSIQKDPYPVDSWDPDSTTVFNLQILGVSLFERMTGFKAPECPINEATYRAYGLPFFNIQEPSSTIHGDFTPLKPLKELYLFMGECNVASSSPTREFTPNSAMPRARIVSFA